MRIRIPAVVSEKGDISACLIRNSAGKEMQDVSLLTEDMPEGIKLLNIDINVEIDLDELFRSFSIEGKAEKQIS